MNCQTFNFSVMKHLSNIYYSPGPGIFSVFQIKTDVNKFQAASQYGYQFINELIDTATASSNYFLILTPKFKV